MLTYSAGPSFQDLGLFFHQPLSEEDLARPWKRLGDTAIWFSKSAWSLATICQAWTDCHSEKTPEIWIPSYFCNQSLWPARQTGAKIGFYPVLPDLTPDWESIRKMSAVTKPDLFLITHFFGQESPTEEARIFCDQVQALLIEDGAHVLRPYHKVGEAADFVFYSLHKLLALPDGALLITRPRASNYQPFLIAAKAKIDEGYASPWKWIAKRWIQKSIPNSANIRRERKNPVRFDDNPQAESMPRLLAPSPLTQRLLTVQSEQLNTIAETRQRNESFYREILRSYPGLKSWPENGRIDRVPYYAVFRCETPLVAQDYFDQFRQRGLIVQTWPDLAPEVLENRSQLKEALNARSTLLTFPVHQSLKFEDIQQYRPR